jgi:hypothetical protein
MDALEMDSNQQGANKAANCIISFQSLIWIRENFASSKFYLIKGNDDLSKSPPGEYTDEMPPLRGLNSFTVDKPPYLPPQLLNIVLNKDTSARVIRSNN